MGLSERFKGKVSFDPGCLNVDGHVLAFPAAVNPQSGVGGAYTFKQSDNGNFVYFTGASAIAPVVPVGLGAGYVCGIIQGGTGQVTPNFSAVTLIPNPHGFVMTFGHGALISIMAVADNVFILVGDGA